ncbi:hypothetical protein EXIGLDRAFT_725313 [Exidia glandulosa HHB12029]|uniref:Transmembrane protein n=1 Tax=Exidia glandulosa HHB12029 TaxID=1314781 RepID=A0A166BA81_EXIGL|nr:hypothetical protein EXIGLDRAFT_725313 [Exidia glandulosa HHB12029]
MALRLERPSDDKRRSERSEFVAALDRERALGRVSQKDRDLLVRIYDAAPSPDNVSRIRLVGAGLGGGLAYMLARRRGWVGFRRGLAIGSAAFVGAIGGLTVLHYNSSSPVLQSLGNLDRERWLDIQKRYRELQRPHRREVVQSQEQEQEAVVLEQQQVLPTLKVKIVDPVWNSFMQDEVAAGRLTQHDSELAQILSLGTIVVYTLYTPITMVLGGALGFVYAVRYKRLRGWRVAGPTVLMATIFTPVPIGIWLVKSSIFCRALAQCDEPESVFNVVQRYQRRYREKETPAGSADAERQQLQWEKFRQELLEKEREREREKRK